MGEAVGWTGLVIAIAGMIRGEFSAYTARRAARDKMEFELKAKELELKHDANEEKITTLMTEIGECKRDRQQLWDKLTASEADRKQMWTELESLKATKKDRTDLPPVPR